MNLETPMIVKAFIVFFAIILIYLYLNPNIQTIQNDNALAKVCSSYSAVNAKNAGIFECENNEFGVKYLVSHPPDECYRDYFDSAGNPASYGCCLYHCSENFKPITCTKPIICP
ncbi:MAG: hypothetical protein Q7S21_03435 [archaeon]|nr:hypothetical protein [archaeon]